MPRPKPPASFRKKDAPVVPDRRTLIVLGSLVMGMTLTSGLLLVLEPGPVAPLTGVSLQSIDRGTQSSGAGQLFDHPDPSRDWRGIIVHASGSEEGSARTLDQLHKELGRSGLGYHFVINNGSFREDGLIELGPRWRQQMPGAYVSGPRSQPVNDRFIGVSLIGDDQQQDFPSQEQMQELLWLVKRLQQRYDIPSQAVIVDTGPTFPHTRFRKQLGPAGDGDDVTRSARR